SWPAGALRGLMASASDGSDWAEPATAGEPSVEVVLPVPKPRSVAAVPPTVMVWPLLLISLTWPPTTLAWMVEAGLAAARSLLILSATSCAVLVPAKLVGVVLAAGFAVPSVMVSVFAGASFVRA